MKIHPDLFQQEGIRVYLLPQMQPTQENQPLLPLLDLAPQISEKTP